MFQAEEVLIPRKKDIERLYQTYVPIHVQRHHKVPTVPDSPASSVHYTYCILHPPLVLEMLCR